jgi:hypothetical protein
LTIDIIQFFFFFFGADVIVSGQGKVSCGKYLEFNTDGLCTYIFHSLSHSLNLTQSKCANMGNALAQS